MAQDPRGTSHTPLPDTGGSSGIDPRVRHCVDTHRAIYGKDPGTQYLLQVLKGCGMGPEAVKKSWRLLKASREEEV